MASYEMWDHLSAVEVTANTTLDLCDSTMPTPQQSLIETGIKNQILHLADDNSQEVVTYSNESIFHVTVVWEALRPTESGEVFTFWHSTGIANGLANKFRFSHPTDGHTYTAQFVTEIVRENKLGNIDGLSAVKLRVLGRAT